MIRLAKADAVTRQCQGCQGNSAVSSFRIQLSGVVSPYTFHREIEKPGDKLATVVLYAAGLDKSSNHSAILINYIDLNCLPGEFSKMPDPEISLQKQLDAICDLFEDQWTVDRRPDFQTFAKHLDGSSNEQLISMLVEIDVELRKKNRIPVSPQDYSELGERIVRQVEKMLDYDDEETIHPSAIEDTPANTTPVASPGNEYQTGTQLGPYRLVRQIGEGGMGSVWLAEQEKPVRRRVALKLIRSGFGSKEIIARFEAERQALAMMNHQNIAKVLDAGTTHDGSPYFVMEMVNGIPLNNYCDEKCLSVRERLRLFIPICKAVEHAHQKGIIHRDLKPSNVLVAMQGDEAIPKVIDFGLAKAIEHTTRLTDKTMFTEFGQVLGTFQYMSPEQSDTTAIDVDTRSDIYSLGVILYELLTGSTPLDKESVANKAMLQVLAHIKEKDPPRPSQRLNASTQTQSEICRHRKISPARLQQILHGELDWVVMKALEKDRRRRYSNASELADEITRYLNDEPVVTRPPSLTYTAMKVFKKNRLLFAALSVGLLLIISLVVSAFVITRNEIAYSNEIKKSYDREQEANKNLRESITNEERAKLDTEKALAKTKLVLASAHIQQGRNQQASNLLESIPSRLRETEWYLSRDEVSGSDLTFRHAGGVSVAQIAYGHDGHLIASCGDDGLIRLWNSATGQPVTTLVSHDQPVTSISFSPDGKQFASIDQAGKLIFWNLFNRKIINDKISLGKGLWKLCFSPNGNQVACVSPDTGCLIIDLQSDKHVVIANTGPVAQVSQVCFSIDGSTLFVSTPDSIKTYDVNKGTLNEVLYQVKDATSSDLQIPIPFSLNPDGTGFVFATGTGMKDQIVYASFDKNRYEVLSQAKGTGLAVSGVQFCQDGEALCVYSGNSIRISTLNNSRVAFDLFGHQSGVTDAVFHPSGMRLASVDQTGEIKTWDCRTGKRNLNFFAHQDPVSSVAVSADGKQFASTDGTQITIWSSGSLQRLQSVNVDSSDLELIRVRSGWSAIGCSQTNRWDARATRVCEL